MAPMKSCLFIAAVAAATQTEARMAGIQQHDFNKTAASFIQSKTLSGVASTAGWGIPYKKIPVVITGPGSCEGVLGDVFEPRPETGLGDSIPEGGNSIPEGGDSIPEGGDSIPEGGDSTPEGGDSTTGGGDSTPEGGESTEGGNDNVVGEGDKDEAEGGGDATEPSAPVGDIDEDADGSADEAFGALM